MEAVIEREYRKVRARQLTDMATRGRWAGRSCGYWQPARCALNVARDEVALQEAENDGLIRFTWEWDQDYEPDGDYDLEEERSKLANGEWEALGCIAETPRVCAHCGGDLKGEWSHAASLWGIVVDVDDRESYRREVERELASEAGVI